MMKKLFILLLILFPLALFNCSEEDVIISTSSLPSRPENLSIAPGDKIAYLRWQAPLNNGGSEILDYKIYRSQSPGNEVLSRIVSANTFTCSDSNLTNGAAYFYYITAVNSDGEGKKSKLVSVRPALYNFTPSIPRNVQIFSYFNSVTLSWMSPYTAGLSPVTHYRIYRRRSIGNMTLINEVSANTTNIIDTALLAYEVYYYCVSAVNNIGEGKRSDSVSAIPLPQNTLTNNSWVSLGDHIAPALRKTPYRFIKIHAAFYDDHTYNITAKDSDFVGITFNGTYQTIDSNSSTGIKQIILNQSSPSVAILQGIFRADSILTYEVIQVQPPVQGFLPPTISGGFGSTTLNGLPLNNEWIQRYIRVMYDQ
jgi:hypothetical protein